jgi:hypothetical protein
MNKPLKAKVPYVLTCSQVGVMNVVILSRSHHEANRPKPTEELFVLYEADPPPLVPKFDTLCAFLATILTSQRQNKATVSGCVCVCVCVCVSVSGVPRACARS